MEMKQIMVVACLLGVSACSDGDTAKRILSENGYTEIETNGFAWLSCSKDDTFKTSFRAKSPSGQHVKGAVCSGWFKGGTIRFD